MYKMFTEIEDKRNLWKWVDIKKKMKLNKLKTLINKQVVTVKKTIKIEQIWRNYIEFNIEIRRDRIQKRRSKLKNSMSLSGSDNLPTRTSLSQRISFIPLHKRRGNIRSAWCRALNSPNFHGCEMLKMLKITTIFGPCTNSFVSWLLYYPLSTYKRKSKPYRECSLDRSSIKSTLNQDEWEPVPINTFWTSKKNQRN